jgi:predicted TIM-barrel fold metal-dependent hydrolase
MPDRLIDAHSHVKKDTLDERLRVMDENTIEWCLAMGTSLTSNTETLACVRQHPDRLIPGVYIDPRAGGAALEELRHWADEGIRIVKLFPNLGYYPDDDLCRPMFETIAELKMAVLSHCGWLMATAGVTASYFARPARFEKVIRRYTETPFILAHMGGIDGFLEAIMLVTRSPNTYVDTAPGQGTWVLQHAGAMAASMPPERILWGADGCTVPALIETCRNSLIEHGRGGHLTDVFYGNARSLFEKIGAIEAT